MQQSYEVPKLLERDLFMGDRTACCWSTEPITFSKCQPAPNSLYCGRLQGMACDIGLIFILLVCLWKPSKFWLVSTCLATLCNHTIVSSLKIIFTCTLYSSSSIHQLKKALKSSRTIGKFECHLNWWNWIYSSMCGLEEWDQRKFREQFGVHIGSGSPSKQRSVSNCGFLGIVNFGKALHCQMFFHSVCR